MLNFIVLKTNEFNVEKRISIFQDIVFQRILDKIKSSKLVYRGRFPTCFDPFHEKTQVYSQVAFEIMEKKSADVKQGMFSKRNLIPRLVLRTIYMIVCGFFAAMLPFFGDVNAVVGAIGFIPLDFVLPFLLYNISFKPPRSSLIYWINISIMAVFTGVGLLGAFSSIRQLVLDASQFKLFSSNVVD